MGKTTIGGSHGGGLVANPKRVNAYQLNVPASVSKMDIYLSPTGTTGSQVMEGMIYADAGGSPGALVAQSRELLFSSTSAAGWYALPLASDVTLSPGKYLLEIYTGGTSGVAEYRYDVGASDRARVGNNQAYATGGASNPFGTIGWSDKYVMSLYATYTTAAWTVQSVPGPPWPNGHLSGVSCTASATCTAVGSHNLTASGPQVTLTERWNGTSWSIQSTPNPTGAASGALSGVSCTSSTACTAVGSGDSGTLAESWNGTAWSIQTTPPGGGSLNGVSCTTALACTAVGASLAERYA